MVTRRQHQGLYRAAFSRRTEGELSRPKKTPHENGVNTQTYNRRYDFDYIKKVQEKREAVLSFTKTLKPLLMT